MKNRYFLSFLLLFVDIKAHAQLLYGGGGGGTIGSGNFNVGQFTVVSNIVNLASPVIFTNVVNHGWYRSDVTNTTGTSAVYSFNGAGTLNFTSTGNSTITVADAQSTGIQYGQVHFIGNGTNTLVFVGNSLTLKEGTQLNPPFNGTTTYVFEQNGTNVFLYVEQPLLGQELPVDAGTGIGVAVTNNRLIISNTGSGSGGISTLNGLTNSVQTFTAGSGMTITSSGTNHTFVSSGGGSGNAPTNTVVSLSTPTTARAVGVATDTVGTNLTFVAGITISTNTTLNIISPAQIASNPAINGSQTWNAAGVTMGGYKMRVVDTASAAASLVLDVGVSGSLMTVRKDGMLTTPSLQIGGPSSALSILAPIASFGGASLVPLAIENNSVSGSGTGAFYGAYENDGAAMASGDRLGGLVTGGSVSSSVLRDGGKISFFATQPWTNSSAYGTRMSFSLVPNGGTALAVVGGFEQDGRLTFNDRTVTGASLKETGTILAIRLGDDSGDADITARALTLSGDLLGGGTNAWGALAGKMPNTFLAVTNALALTGDTNKFLNGAGQLATVGETYAPTNTMVSLSFPSINGGVWVSQGTTGTNAITTNAPGFTSFVNATHNHQNAAGGGTLAEAALALTDITTANASITAHGFVPKYPNDATKFLNGVGAYATPAGGGDALTTNPLSQFAATTSAQFAGVISDESGSGLVILQTSPTIITPTIASFANANHNHQNSAGGGTLAEAALALTDITTANASTSAHGFVKKLPNDATLYYDGTGNYSLPAGGGGSGTVGTMINTTTPVLYDLYRAKDTTTTNAEPSTIVANGSSLKLGHDAASPVAQTIIASGPRGGTDSNTAGVDAIMAGSPGTGTGAGGKLIFKTSSTGSSGSATNASATALTLDASQNATFGGSITAGSAQSIYVGTGGLLAMGNRSRMYSGSDGQIQFYNNGSTGFTTMLVGIDDATPDSFVNIRAANGVGTDKVSGGIQIDTGTTTGTGVPGALELRTSIKGTASSSTAQAIKTRIHISGVVTTLTESSATKHTTITLASGKSASYLFKCQTRADDGTDFQTRTDTIQIDAVNKAGTVATTVSVVTSSAYTSTGTLTTTWTATANGNNVDVFDNAVSSLTQTTLVCSTMSFVDANDASTFTDL